MKLRIREIAVFAVLGTLMFLSKLWLEFLPNIHLVAVLICAYTLQYRAKALYPIYVFVIMSGVYYGFSMWWLPYLYIWTVLWAVVMLLPKKMKKPIAAAVYMTVCGLHGIMFGVLYAPAQALMMGFSFQQTLAWIAAGFYFDIIHGVGNFALATLVLPLTKLLNTAERLTRSASSN